MTVPQGSACVEPYAHAIVFTKAHTRKNGTETKVLGTYRYSKSKTIYFSLQVLCVVKVKQDKILCIYIMTMIKIESVKWANELTCKYC